MSGMMPRIALVVLVLANLLFFVWSRMEGRPEPAASNVNPSGVMQVATASARPRTHCQRFGPFTDQDSAVKAAAALAVRGLQTRMLTREALRVTRWAVRLTGLDSKSALDAAVSRLRRVGVTDTAIIGSTSGETQLFAGMFSDPAAAQRRVQAVERAGFKTEILERKQSMQEFWVSSEVAAQSALPSGAELGMTSSGDLGAVTLAWDNC